MQKSARLASRLGGLALALIMSLVHQVFAAEGAKEEWVKDLVTRLNNQRRYPVLASDQGGKAKVLFHLDRSGHLVSVALVESTGDAFLDEEALAMIERVQPIPAPPAELADGELMFVVPVVFARRPGSTALFSQQTRPDEAALQARLKASAGDVEGCCLQQKQKEPARPRNAPENSPNY